MPSPKYTTPKRYFVARERDAIVPTDRLLYLELDEIDTDAGVARFSYELADPDAELWVATVQGWESRDEVRARVRSHAFASWLEGGVLTIPLTAEPKVTQIEVRRADLSVSVIYRITTQGMDARTFRYRTESDASEAEVASRWSMRIEDARPRFAIVERNGRPVFDEAGGADSYAVIEDDGRPVLDREAAAGVFTPAIERGALMLVDDYGDAASGFVRPIAYTAPLPDADEPFDDRGRPAYEKGAAPSTWRHARAAAASGAGLMIYRSASDE